jgi:tetratricopeptide (TPR) repeat protein
MEMVWIPAGEAELGMVEEDQEIAHYIMPPMHVRMDGYWIGKYEVTNAQWKAIIGKVEDGGEPDLPAAHMYLEDCEAFAQKTSELSGRRYAVPTEAQWEYACRAGTRSTWFFGSKPDRVHEYGWVGRPADGSGPDRVGRKKPNPWGLYDMYGNVAEWTYSLSTSVTNPSAPDPLNPKGFVMRGGAGSFSPLGCSSSSRDWNSRRRGTSFYGFRIARVQGAYVGGTAKPVKLPDAVIRPDPPPVAGMDTDALIARGDALMKTAQYENALRAYTAAAQIAPRSAQARLNRGYALNALDRTEEAIEEFSAALSIDSSLAKAYGNRGYARYKLKQYQGTINDCSKAIELDRGYARAYFNRARAHRQLGNTRAYNADRQAALRLDPRITD